MKRVVQPVRASKPRALAVRRGGRERLHERINAKKRQNGGVAIVRLSIQSTLNTWCLRLCVNRGPRLLYKDVCCHTRDVRNGLGPNDHPLESRPTRRIVTMHGWQWDAARGDYWYFSSEENAFVYRSGARVMATGINQNIGVTETQAYELFVVHSWNKELSQVPS